MYRAESQPEISRKPARIPDGFVAINNDGFIMGGDKPFKRNQNLFDYVTSKCAANSLKKAMSKATEKIPSDIEISFKLQQVKIRCFCLIYKSDDRFLIGGWRLPKNLIHFPNNDTAA